MLIEGSKGVFRFGMLGPWSMGFCLCLGFCVLRLGAGLHVGPGQWWFYHKNVFLGLVPRCHLFLSWMVWLGPASGHREAVASVDMTDKSMHTKVSIFLPLSNQKGGEGAFTSHGAPCLPPFSLPAFTSLAVPVVTMSLQHSIH